MERKLVVDGGNGAQAEPSLDHQPQNIVTRIVAKIISYVFHPLFVPVYIAWFLLTVYPFFFSNFSDTQYNIPATKHTIIFSPIILPVFSTLEKSASVAKK